MNTVPGGTISFFRCVRVSCLRVVAGWALDARLDADLEVCYALAADGGAAVMGLPRADLQPGSPADFMLLDGECVPQIVVDVPRRDTVVRADRVVARDGLLL
ncbi:hypothetical protein [Rhodococcus opacus]|uniref:hypothetical protein n=1 Tax=Rhodococcus opacus TaxID=37919 RepID=UPI001F5470E8|nr:hypothetical protein [Rhodococcus opacus]